MEVEDIHVSKRSRMGNGDGGANAVSGSVAAATRVAQEQRQLQDEDEEDGEGRSLMLRGGGGCTAAGVRVALRQWNQSTASRIYRVSRASGGKDRHSKVMTAKGLRDRRVRLSVSTAIQFYDLQDRLGYDQPSKAIEWLIKAAATAIADLPPLDGAFSDQRPPVSQPVDDEKPAGGADEEDEEDADVSQLQYTDHHHHLQHQREEHQPQQRQQQQRFSLTKSTCSSTSETSKGSVLSLSRSEIRVKARERARERTATAKDKEKDKDDMEDDAHVVSAAHHQGMNPNPVSQSSFTELLTGGGHQNHGGVTIAQANHPATSFVHKHLRQLPTSATAATTTDYFGQVGLLGTGQKPHQPTIFPTQTHFGGNSSPMGMVPFNFAAVAAAAGDHPAEMQQQQYMQEHLIPFAVTAAGGDYINFSISSGFNRGTLQSNSPSPLLHHHLQMFSSPVDGSNLPFFLGAAAQATSASGEGQMPAGFDSRLHLCYRHPDLKGKGKN